MRKAAIPKSLRERVAHQERYRCGYCLMQALIADTPMEIEHIFPEALGGPTIEENLWLACSLCNAYKGNQITGYDPETGTIVELFNPRHQRWLDHFAWSVEGDRIIGLTPTGRATVILLKVNRSILVGARQIWVTTGWHPPADTR